MQTGQLYKSVSFPATTYDDNSAEIVRLAFNKDSDLDLFIAVKDLRSSDIRTLLGNIDHKALVDFASQRNLSLNSYCLGVLRAKHALVKKTYGLDASFSKALSSSLFSRDIDSNSVTFKNAKTENIHRWYPYIEGYSCDFVHQILDSLHFVPNVIYDPFAGSGTTQIVASHRGIPSLYSEVNPYMRFVIETKINTVKKMKGDWEKYASLIKEALKNLETRDADSADMASYLETFSERNYFKSDVLKDLLSIKKYVTGIKDPDVRRIFLLSLSSITVEVSNTIRRSDLRYRTEKELLKSNFNVDEIFRAKLTQILDDLQALNIDDLEGTSLLIEDAKKSVSLRDKYDVVITSPPYVNGTNYFRNTKLELWITDNLKSEDDLRIFRDMAVTAGINDVKMGSKPSYTNEHIEQIVKDLREVAYDKRIPIMIQQYFSDMHEVFLSLASNLSDHGKIFLDIGDSQFAGIHVPADEVLIELGKDVGLELEDKKFLRERYSKNGMKLSQFLLVFSKTSSTAVKKGFSIGISPSDLLVENYSEFKNTLPYKDAPFSKRNWGHSNHSLCSYQGKLKPSIAHHLINLFTKEGMTVLDPLGGVGTIPFEAALNGRFGVSNDISLLAYANSLAKLSIQNETAIFNELEAMEKYILASKISDADVNAVKVDFNRPIQEYYHPDTFKEILAARNYFRERKDLTPEQALILSSLLHVLHGNRPYALSRRSHSITPFAPQGAFEYRNVMLKTKEKVERILDAEIPTSFVQGKSILGDYRELRNKVESNSVDVVITSPPFYSSTRFYLANWIRMWFCGWDKLDFERKKEDYLETRQMVDFNIYKDFFSIMKDLVKKDGTLIMHLGRSSKFNMGLELAKIAKDYFNVHGLVDEDVAHLEKFGVMDQGSTNGHQYLFLING